MNPYIAIILGVIGIVIVTIYSIWDKLTSKKEKSENNGSEEKRYVETTISEAKNENTKNNITVWKIALGVCLGIIMAYIAIILLSSLLVTIGMTTIFGKLF